MIDLDRMKCPKCKAAVFAAMNPKGEKRLYDLREHYTELDGVEFLFKGFPIHVCDGRKRR